MRTTCASVHVILIVILWSILICFKLKNGVCKPHGKGLKQVIEGARAVVVVGGAVVGTTALGSQTRTPD
jgi:hypothetical protein